MPGRKSPGGTPGGNTPTRCRSRTSEHSSKASINVTLPGAGLKDDIIRGVSPERQHKFPQGQQSYPQTGTIPPMGTPTTQAVRTLTDQDFRGRPVTEILSKISELDLDEDDNDIMNDKILRIIAARRIERTWLSYRDKQMFKLLKHAVCAAEHSLSHEILRKVSPKEADLLKDKSMRIRVRFRFGGMEYPPMIFFKVYTSTSSGIQTSIKYVSGKRMIQPASEAARDACDLMGNKKFYEQMILDIMQQEKYGITSEVDITTLKDYMQYLSLLDETPAYLGGKDNSWRKLTLEVLPRQTVFYDIVDFLYGQKMSPMLQEQLPKLLSRPITQDIQIEHMRIIAQTRDPYVPSNTPKTAKSESQISSRRSRQAKQRALKMKRLYETGKQEGYRELTGIAKEITFESKTSQVQINAQADVINDDDDIPDEEADKLYEWTQELSMDDLTAEPRLSTTEVN